MQTGDTFTIAGIHPVIANPARRWWQFWKPRKVADRTRLAMFTVKGVV